MHCYYKSELLCKMQFRVNVERVRKFYIYGSLFLSNRTLHHMSFLLQVRPKVFANIYLTKKRLVSKQQLSFTYLFWILFYQLIMCNERVKNVFLY